MNHAMNIHLLLIVLALILAALSYWKPVLLGVAVILIAASFLVGCTYDEINRTYRAAGAAIGAYQPTPRPVVVIDDQE